MIITDNTLLQGYTFIDLFAGLGGFRLALESLGAKCIYSNEWDKHAQEVYSMNFGETPEGDITKVDEKTIPNHDIICAGFPCQAFSISGKQLGFNDSRGTLFFDVARIVKEKRPKVVFIPDSVYVYTVGLPNDRLMTLQEQMAYDDVLRKAMASRWDEFSDCFTLRRIKMYENFIFNRMFHILFPYYSDLRKSLTRKIPFADRLAVILPPRIAYLPIKLRKSGLI